MAIPWYNLSTGSAEILGVLSDICHPLRHFGLATYYREIATSPPFWGRLLAMTCGVIGAAQNARQAPIFTAHLSRVLKEKDGFLYVLYEEAAPCLPLLLILRSDGKKH